MPKLEKAEVAASFHAKLLDALPSLAADLAPLADWRVWVTRAYGSVYSYAAAIELCSVQLAVAPVGYFA